MSKFEILCATMYQKDFSKIQQMNIHSDVIFTNQADRTAMEEMKFEGHCARMITTDTRGLGINRNLALLYAQGEICLLADDDVTYYDDMERQVLSEFDAHPDADIIIFHLNTDSNRKLKKYSRTQKCNRLYWKSWGSVRIAFKLQAVRKANIWFSTVFGSGGVFSSGEDSLWIADVRKRGLTIYVSKETIGSVSFEKSTWFSGYDECYFYNKGAFYQAAHPRTILIWMAYFILRTRKLGTLPASKKLKWMRYGREGYREMKSYDTYCGNQLEKV